MIYAAASARALAMITFRVHVLQSRPPYGLSGRLELFGSARTCALVPRATPGSTFSQSAHCGAAFLRLLYSILLIPLGVVMYTRLNVLERYFGATMLVWEREGFIKVSSAVLVSVRLRTQFPFG